MYQRCYILPKHQYLMNLYKQIKDEHLLWMLRAWCSWTMTNVPDDSGHWCGLPCSDLFCASADPNGVPPHDQQVFYGALTGVTLKLMSNIVPPLNYYLYRNWRRDPPRSKFVQFSYMFLLEWEREENEWPLNSLQTLKRASTSRVD